MQPESKERTNDTEKYMEEMFSKRNTHKLQRAMQENIYATATFLSVVLVSVGLSLGIKSSCK